MNQIGIIAKNISVANEVFDKLIGEIKYKDVSRVSKTKGAKWEAVLKDGTLYRVTTHDDTARGHRFTDLYIQKGIDELSLQRVVYPWLINHEDGSNPTIIWFD
jgi:hypothetical protein